MKRIRIGNDIRVQTTLHELNDFDSTAVKQVICYFIPSGEVIPEQPKTYDPAQYNICNCGKPAYNVFPCNIDAPHWFCGYNGFGVNSVPFICTKSKYTALARVLKEENRIEAYFPAKEQKYIGEYKVVFVVVMYKDGWDQNNLRTYTIDKGEVFALTSDNDDITTDTIIDLDTPYVVKIESPKIIKMTGDTIRLGQSINTVKYQITLTYSDGTKSIIDSSEKYTGVLAQVHSVKGSVFVNNVGEIVRDKYNSCDAYITYTLYDNPKIQSETHLISESIFRTVKYRLLNSMSDDEIISVSGLDEIEVNDALPSGRSVFQIEFKLSESVIDLIVTADNAVIKHNAQDPIKGPYMVCTPITDNIIITAEVWGTQVPDRPGGNPDFD